MTTQKHPQVQTKEKKSKSQQSKPLVSLAKGPGRDSLEKTKFLNNNLSSFAKHHRKNHGHIPTQASKGLLDSQDFHPQQRVKRHPTLSHWHSVRKDFHHHAVT